MSWSSWFPQNNAKQPWSTLQSISPSYKFLAEIIQINQTQFMICPNNNYGSDTCKEPLIYDIKSNEWIKANIKYKNIKLNWHTLCMNKRTEIIYIYDCIDDKLTQIDLKQNSMNIIKTNLNPKIGAASTSIIINGKCNILGGSENRHHLIWNEEKNEFDKIHEFKHLKRGIWGQSISFIEEKNIVLMFGGRDTETNKVLDDIYLFNATNKKWKKLQTKLPQKRYFHSSLLSKNGKYVAIFGGMSGDLKYTEKIYLYDVETEEIKESHIECPSHYCAFRSILINEQIHLVQCGATSDFKHFCISSNDIFDTENDDDFKNDGINKMNISNEFIIKNEALNHENMTLKYENKKLRNDLKISESAKYELRKMNNKLMDDFKELELSRNAYKLKYESLKKELKMDAANYLNWDCDDIVNWIRNIDHSRFQKYEHKLRENMKTENVDGQCLNEIEINDIHRFGIHDFKDKKYLMRQIKMLTKMDDSQNNNNNNNNIQSEGQ